MFEDEELMAANTEETETQSTPPVETQNQTQAFAKRLKEEKAKARLEAKEEIAKEFGYSSWQEYADAQTNNKLLDNGLDPESVRPVLQDLIKNDPDYIEAMKFKAEKEELEKELFASNSLKALNDKFGTNYKSVDELDPGTIEDWNKGTPLEKAFAANNYTALIDMAVKKAGSSRDNGKSHLKTVTGSGEQTQVREISKEELNVARMFGFSEEQFRNYVNRTKK
jgi:hypothetical protein